MQVIFVLTGLIFLIATIAQLVLDMVNMFKTTQFHFEALSASVVEYFPNALDTVRSFIISNLADAQWIGYVDWVLSKPTFGVLGVIGLFFIFLSFIFRKKKFKKGDREFI